MDQFSPPFGEVTVTVGGVMSGMVNEPFSIAIPGIGSANSSPNSAFVMLILYTPPGASSFTVAVITVKLPAGAGGYVGGY